MLHGKACFPNAFPSYASHVWEIIVTFLPHQQSFMALELQGKFRRAHFIFQGSLETNHAVYELLGFPQDLAFSRAMLSHQLLSMEQLHVETFSKLQGLL